MKLKSENIDLIEKLNLFPRKMDEELAQSKIQLSRIEEELSFCRNNEKELEGRLRVAEEAKEKLEKKVEKYKN